MNICQNCDEWSEWKSCPACEEPICGYCVYYVEQDLANCDTYGH
jgi:hypothetical protein